MTATGEAQVLSLFNVSTEYHIFLACQRYAERHGRLPRVVLIRLPLFVSVRADKILGLRTDAVLEPFVGNTDNWLLLGDDWMHLEGEL